MLRSYCGRQLASSFFTGSPMPAVQRRVYPADRHTSIIFTEIERPNDANGFTVSIKSNDFADTVRLPLAFGIALEKAVKGMQARK